jgi:hypothetical protein
MGEILSTNKPKELHPKPDPAKTIEGQWNDRSYQSYVESGFAEHIPHHISAPRDRIIKFLAATDIRNGPINRTVRMICRCKAPDWTSPKHERREWIWYEEVWSANNWLNIPVDPLDGHIEGRYTEVVTRPKFDPIKGTHIDNVFAGTREVYYIPFTKAAVDEIIKNSTLSEKSNIRYIVKFAQEDSVGSDTMAMTMSMRNQFSYDMFLWPWDKLYEWNTWAIDDIAARPRIRKSATKLEFKPT